LKKVGRKKSKKMKIGGLQTQTDTLY
jgi:hypothetical protein